VPAARLPMFPLSAVLYPHASMPLHVFEPRYRALMRECLAGDSRFGVVLIERGSEVGGGDQRAPVGTRGVITRSLELPDGRWALVVQGEAVVRVEEWLPDDPYPLALVSELQPAQADVSLESDDPEQLLRLMALTTGRVRHVRALLAEHGSASPLSPDETFEDEDPDRACWRLCHAAPVSAYDAQRLLAASGAAERLGMLEALMEELEGDLRRMLGGE
jgi:Lon protease-like protein